MRRVVPKHLCVAVLAVLGVAFAQSSSRAAQVTDVATAFDEDNPFDFRLRIGYDHQEKRASIKRELELPGQDTIPTYRDLLYNSSRDRLLIRAEFGIFQDLMFSAELPIVLHQSEEYHFDQSASPCIFPGQGVDMPTCVNASNSSTVNDGLVPGQGYDAQSSGSPTVGDLLFRGNSRGGFNGDGLDTLNLALTYAILSQHRDDTKPTWTLRLEGDIQIGNIQKFSRASLANGLPSLYSDNHAVSEGLHWLKADMAISKRFTYIDPYISFWYGYPIPASNSLFLDYGPNEKNKNPQMRAGTVFGMEGIPWERPQDELSIRVQLQGRIEAHFDGRGYSEIWEMLASADPLACVQGAMTQNPTCDGNSQPGQVATLYNDSQEHRVFTGITQIENYATLGADVAIIGQLGKYVRFWAGFMYTHDQSHFITGEDVGQSSTTGGRVSSPSEYNPTYRPIIDQVGRRYKVDDVNIYDVGLWAQLMF